jgi:hypothetical protein
MTRTIGLLMFGLALGFSSGQAQADYVTYSDRASFLAGLAPAGVVTETFNELGTPVQTYTSPLVLPIGNVTGAPSITYSSLGAFKSGGSPDLASGSYSSYGTYLVGPSSGRTAQGITITPPANTYTAIGLDLTTFLANGKISFIATTILDGTFSGSFTVPASDGNNTMAFFGLTTSSPTDYITSLQLNTQANSSQQIVVDNVSFGPVTATIPEPGSLALLTVGALALGVRASRRRLS